MAPELDALRGTMSPSGRLGGTVETSEVQALKAGVIVGGAYRVLRPIAEGGMGVIYEVEQTATGARRALKVMHGRFASDPQLRARFVREARLAASIESDHIAQVTDAGQDEATGALYIVMELLEGTTLSRELRRNGAFEWTAALEIISQIAHALGAAHGLGIVHRDLKPANVFLTRSRHAALPFTVKLLDFGIAKAVADAGEATVAVLGTPSWMAPEQTTADAPIGPQADVWSLGLLTFLLLTGSHYFSSANNASVQTAAVLREVVLDPLLQASDRARQLGEAERLPDGFDAWFSRCVDRSPANRFGDARSAYEALTKLPAPEPTGLQPPVRSWSQPIAVPRVETPITAVETPHASRVSARLAPTGTAASASSTPATTGVGVSRPNWLRVVPFLAGVAIVASLVWRSHPTDKPTATSTRMPAPVTAPISIRLHGSNTIGAELGPALAEAFLQRRSVSKAIVRRRTAPDEVLVEAHDGDRIVEAIEVFAHGTATAFEDLGAGLCDVGMASRAIRPDEAQKLASLGDLASAASEHVIALDGIAVIVNPANRVSTLAKSQIADVFAGKVRRWSEVGGEDAPIVVHARDDRSGTYDTFKHLVLGGGSLVADAKRHESSDELSDAVAADPRAVGFIGLPYVRSAKAVMVQEAGSVPTVPSPMTVSTEDYPLARRLYMYVPLGAPIVARDLVDFALSEDGQKVVQSAGFVDLRPTCDPNAARCTTCPREYRDAVRGACRMSMDFRFDRGNSQLDTRALRDLQRVVAMLGRPEHAGRSLLLFGFSDAKGPLADSVGLSQQRVAVVSAQLEARGLRVDVARGLGPSMPVGDDATDDGRERNRRVEVWLK
jgi:phosphate transport system substrate-binding protein